MRADRSDDFLAPGADGEILWILDGGYRLQNGGGTLHEEPPEGNGSRRVPFTQVGGLAILASRHHPVAYPAHPSTYIMIHGVHLVNFGNHEDSRFEFGALNALVGRNGAGKSLVLHAIRELARIASTESHGIGAEGTQTTIPSRYVRAGAHHFGISASGPGKRGGAKGEWGIVVSGDEQHRPEEETERTAHVAWSWHEGASAEPWIPHPWPEVDGSGKTREELFEHLISTVEQIDHPSASAAAIEDPTESEVKGPAAEWVSQWAACQYMHGAGRHLHEPSYTPEIPPRLSSRGENLASVIAYLMTSEPDRFAELSAAFTQLIPFVKRIRVRPARVTVREKKVVTVNRKDVSFDEDREMNGHELLFDLESGKGISACAVSEGTLISLALLTLFHVPQAPGIVLIDDIDQALHPWAQRRLIQQLRHLVQQRPKLQIILATHSPFIVDELQPHEVWMLAEREGVARVRQLSDHPDLSRAKGALTNGELWDAEAEGWVLELRG